MGQVVLPALTGWRRRSRRSRLTDRPGALRRRRGLIAFNRASKIAATSSERLHHDGSRHVSRGHGAGAVGGLALLALSLTDVDDKAGLANTTMGAMAGLMVGGPWGLAIGAGVSVRSRTSRRLRPGRQRRSPTPTTRCAATTRGRWPER
jgi:hypothetical protein